MGYSDPAEPPNADVPTRIEEAILFDLMSPTRTISGYGKSSMYTQDISTPM